MPEAGAEVPWETHSHLLHFIFPRNCILGGVVWQVDKTAESRAHLSGFEWTLLFIKLAFLIPVIICKMGTQDYFILLCFILMYLADTVFFCKLGVCGNPVLSKPTGANSICSLHVFGSHLGNSCNISK